MIEPSMAMKDSFILTDIEVPRDVLHRVFSRVVEKTFNRITIDSDQSTSDMAIILSSNKKPLSSIEAFEEALFSVCKQLSHDIVRNGAVANSPLVKTAVFGNDPNVGRIISSLGDYTGNSGITIDPLRLNIRMGGETIFDNGSFTLDQQKEERLTEYLKTCSMDSGTLTYPPHQRTVDIEIDLGIGDCTEEVLASDLTYDYIRENADYRS